MDKNQTKKTDSLFVSVKRGEKRRKPLKEKLSGMRLNFTLVRSILTEMQEEKRLKDKERAYSVFTLLSSKFCTLDKTHYCCAKEDFHLLHFKQAFFRHKKHLRDFFDWKIAKALFAKETLHRLGKMHRMPHPDISRLHYIYQIKSVDIEKELFDMQTEMIMNARRRQKEDRSYFNVRTTHYS